MLVNHSVAVHLPHIAYILCLLFFILDAMIFPTALLSFSSATSVYPMFTNKEVVRLIQPFLTVPLFSLLYIVGFVLNHQERPNPRESSPRSSRTQLQATVLPWGLTLNLCFFVLGIVGFCQGNALHLTANMCSRGWQAASTPSVAEQSVQVDFWRTYVEHAVAHYFFLTGAVIIFAALLVLFGSVDSPALAARTAPQKICFLFACLEMSALFVAIAFDFPYGRTVFFIVCLVYVLSMGVLYLCRRYPKGFFNTFWLFCHTSMALTLLGVVISIGIVGF